MPRVQYAPATQFVELMRRSGLPENTAATNAFRMLAHTPAVSASVLRVILALLLRVFVGFRDGEPVTPGERAL